MVDLIAELYCGTSFVYGSKEIKVRRGVVQGGILSPFLFNVYLEEALQSSSKLKEYIEREQLLAFADDLLLMAKDPEELDSMIAELENLQEIFGLVLNR